MATLAWNGYRHLEAWYGITGLGAIYHTVNPRLFPEQIAWIVNHAEDRIVMTDLTFVPLLEGIADQLPSVERYVVLDRRGPHAGDEAANAVAYEDWLAEVDGDFAGPSSTSTPPPASATPRARPAIPRACSIRTAPTCCIR